MSHVLITFLGKTEKDGGLYSPECYHFENDDEKYETHFFGLAVLKHLANQKKKPDKLVILGTPSSSWDAFFQLGGEVNSEYEDEYLELAQAIEDNFEYPDKEEKEEEKIAKYLTTSLKQALSKYLNANKLENVDCELRVIPYGENQEAQVAILEKMADCVNEKDTVSLDITHGLRHLPMLVVLSAMYLEVVKKVTIAGIYYGAEQIKNRHDKVAPALDLTGLLQIAKWVGKLNSFDNNGDYSVFTDVLKDDGFSQAELLKKAAYFERSINLEKATTKLDKINTSLTEKKDLPGIGKLFSEQLKERLSWHQFDGEDVRKKVYAQQRKLALSYFEKRDYVRAANFALEAMITHSLNPGNEPYNYADRDQVKGKVPKSLYGENKSNYYLLKEIRNQLAHGSYDKKIEDDDWNQELKQETLRKAKNLLEDENKLRPKLKMLIKTLLTPWD